MRTVRARLYVAAALVWVLAPFPAYAASIWGSVGCSGIDCQICNIAALVQGVINFSITISIPIVAALFAYAGYLYATAGARGKPGDIKTAHDVFVTAGFGFVLILSGWLIINTILHALVPNSSKDWFNLECVSQASRPTTVSVPEVFSELFSGFVGGESGVSGTGGAGSGGGNPVNLTALRTTAQTGLCAQAATDVWSGTTGCYMSYICAAESGGIAGRLSGVDKTADGKSFSAGLFQINMTQNNPAGNLNFAPCTEAVRKNLNRDFSGSLNCSQAFSGTNYKATVKDQGRYAACITAAKDPTCNMAAANYLLSNSGGLEKGLNNWSVWKQKSTVPQCN